MRIFSIGLIFAVGVMILSLPGYAQHSFNNQLSQVQTNDFDGQWVGYGRSSPNLSRNRCGDGPIIELTVQAGIAKATLKLVTQRAQKIDIAVIPLRGTIDDQGNMKLAGYESKVLGILSASKGLGEGTWEIVTHGCRGAFELRYKASVFAWPTSSGGE